MGIPSPSCNPTQMASATNRVLLLFVEGCGACVLYVSFASRVRPRTLGCVVMGSAVLFILKPRLLLYSTESGVNRLQVVSSGFSVILLCFVQVFFLCRYGCMYF